MFHELDSDSSSSDEDTSFLSYRPLLPVTLCNNTERSLSKSSDMVLQTGKVYYRKPKTDISNKKSTSICQV